MENVEDLRSTIKILSQPESHCHAQFDEKFLRMPSVVVDAMNFLDQMSKANQMEDTSKRAAKKNENVFEHLGDGLKETDFITSKRSTSRRHSSFRKSKSKSKTCANTNQFTFMRQIDQTPEQRAQALAERVRVANNYRKLGNAAYRKSQYDTAIDHYSRGLDYIRDTPVLILNRACCYIRQRAFSRAIMDCDYVLHKIDPKHLQAWLYRAVAYRRSLDETKYEECIAQARRLNHNKLTYIATFLERMRNAPY